MLKYGDPKKSKDIIYFPSGKIKAWKNLQDVELFIRPAPFVINILGLEWVDENRQMAKTTLPGTYPLTRMHWSRTDGSKSCWIENVPEALDTPGEWMLNTDEGKLYLWPKNGSPGKHIIAPVLKELIRIEGNEDRGKLVRNLVFEDLMFTHGDRDTWSMHDAGLQHDWEMFNKSNALIRLVNAENCTIKNCCFENSGGTAIRLDMYCQNNVITGNAVSNIGGTGILLCGYGPGIKDVNKNNLVTGNHIYQCGQIYWHSPAIMVWQSGDNRIANNLIHHTPYSGIVISGVRPHFFKFKTQNQQIRECARTIRFDEVGNAITWDDVYPFLHARNNVIEYNEIHHVVEKLDDGNGIYLSGTGPGNIVCRNYVHHLLAAGVQGAIRTDAFQKETMIAENLIYHCVYAGIMLKQQNDLINNIVADLVPGTTAIGKTFYPKGFITLRIGPCIGSKIHRNILYNTIGRNIPFIEEGVGSSISYFKPGYIRECDLDSNIYYDTVNPDWAMEFLAKTQAENKDRHSLATDPLFSDPENGDFFLGENSPARELNIKNVSIKRLAIKNH